MADDVNATDPVTQAFSSFPRECNIPRAWCSTQVLGRPREQRETA